jgi:hypothetical protein
MTVDVGDAVLAALLVVALVLVVTPDGAVPVEEVLLVPLVVAAACAPAGVAPAGVVSGDVPVGPVVLPIVPVVPVAPVGPAVVPTAPEVPVVPVGEGDVDEPDPTRVFGSIGVRPSPTIAGVAGDPVGATPLVVAGPVTSAEPGPVSVATPVGLLAGTQGSGLPFGSGTPGCRLPDCDVVDVPGSVVAELAPAVGAEGVVALCASRETMSAAVSSAVAPALAVLNVT